MRYDHGETAATLLAPASPRPFSVPDFTVGSALRWLGHECPGQPCWAPIEAVAASVWFLRRARHDAPVSVGTRVLVDTFEIGDGVAISLQVMHRVNGCTRRDAIEVRCQPRHVQNRRKPPVEHRVPVSPLMGVHPVEMPGPTNGDLHAITMASPW